ncbi:hypothetical protein Tco_1460430 [Tanacetum coccineum]
MDLNFLIQSGIELQVDAPIQRRGSPKYRCDYLLLQGNALWSLNDVAYSRRTIVYKEHACLLYQKKPLIKSLKTMVFIMNKPPKGLPVGGIDNGGVPMLTSSTTFEKDLISCMKLLAIALKKIGAEAKDTDSFHEMIREYSYLIR